MPEVVSAVEEVEAVISVALPLALMTPEEAETMRASAAEVDRLEAVLMNLEGGTDADR